MVNNLQIFDTKLCLHFHSERNPKQRGWKLINTWNWAFRSCESGVKSAPVLLDAIRIEEKSKFPRKKDSKKVMLSLQLILVSYYRAPSPGKYPNFLWNIHDNCNFYGLDHSGSGSTVVKVQGGDNGVHQVLLGHGCMVVLIGFDTNWKVSCD